jgi:3-hydroxyacyl-[acyl-carrier-protein] dehydratase
MPTVLELPIPPDHPAFAGHFPGTPIVPGVVLLDEALYAIAAAEGLAPVHCTLKEVKFRRLVRPGERVTLTFGAAGSGRVRFELASGGEPVASGTLVVAGADGGVVRA